MRSLISGKINPLHFLFLLFFIHTYLRVFSETHWKHSLNGGKRGGIGKEEMEAEAMVGTMEKRLEPVTTVSRRATSCSTAQN